MVNGKLTGNLKWACNGTAELCSQAIDYFNDVVAHNSDFLDITNDLVSDYSKADGYIKFISSDDIYQAGEWNPLGKRIEMNSNYLALKRGMQHEYGHALGLYHSPNETMNFMSYFGMGSTYQNIDPVLSGHQRYWLREAYTKPWYQFWR